MEEVNIVIEFDKVKGLWPSYLETNFKVTGVASVDGTYITSDGDNVELGSMVCLGYILS